MADRYSVDQQQNTEPLINSPASRDAMTASVIALEAALLPCLPARELQAIDRSAHPYHQIDVERHARDFMEAAKKPQLNLIGLQCEGDREDGRRVGNKKLSSSLNKRD